MARAGRMTDDNAINWRGLLGAAADALVEGVVLHDDQARIRALNAAAARILGVPELPPGGGPEWPPYPVLTAGGSPLERDAHPVVRALRENEPQPATRIGIDLPGGRRWLSVSASPLRSPGAQRPFGAVGCVLDVTEEVDAEERRRAVEERLLAAIDVAPVPTVIVDADDRVRSWNGAAAQLFGWSREEVLGNRLPIVPEDLRERYERGREHERRGGSLPGREARRRRRDGSHVTVEVFTAPLWDRDGHVRGTLGLFFDVSRRRAALDALAEQERRWRTLASVAPVGILTTDRDLRCTYANERWCTLVGRPAEAAIGDGWQEAIHPDGRDGVVGAWRAAAAAGTDFACEFRARRPEGEIRWVSLQASPVEDAEGYVATAADITAAMRAQAALVAAEERFRRVFEEAPMGMAIVELDGRLSAVNEALCSVLGAAAPALEGRELELLTHPDDRPAAREQTARLIAGTLPSVRAEKRLLRSDGEAIWTQVDTAALARDPDGRPRALIAQVQDITERRRLEARMRHLADHDPLTGLLNRRRFAEELERHVGEIKRYGPAGALILLDLDSFKEVNDTHGHNAGDRLLLGVAELLRQRLRTTDVLARLGGDEFGILLPRADAAEARKVADDLVAIVRERGGIPEAPDTVTASAGIALLAGDGPEQALMNADVAMYRAKAAGRDCARLYVAG